MKNLLNILLVYVAFFSASCDVNINGPFGKVVRGSGAVVSEKREVQDFDQINLKGSMDVRVTRADEFRCIVKADDNIIPLILTEVRGPSLHISVKGSYSTSQKIAVILELPKLSEIVLSGSGDVNAVDVILDDALLKIAGSGDITATGVAKNIVAEINGSGSLNLASLKVDHVDVAVNGSGDAAVWATESLNAKVNGSGDIIYSGDPEKIDRAVNGSGDIVKK